MDNKKSEITRFQVYFFAIAGILMVISSSFNYGYVDSLLGVIAGAIFISTVLTKYFKNKIKKKKDSHLKSSVTDISIGGIVAGLFMTPVEFFIYIKDDSVTIVIFLIFIIISIVIGSLVGFLLNYKTKQQN